MKLQRVYIDTSVIGGCFNAEFATWSNRLMQDFHKERLKAVVSDLVAVEVNDTASQKSRIQSKRDRHLTHPARRQPV